jgi:3-dehydrosphinganine reductase
MGRCVAKILAQKGANIMVVARNVTKLESTIEELKVLHSLQRYGPPANPYSQAAASSPSQRFQYLSADVTKENEATRIISEATTWNSGTAPDVVWCLAGGSLPTLFLNATSSQLRQQMDLNYWSQADIAHAILSEWLSPASITAAEKEGKERHLIFTATSLAFYSVAGYGPYSPPKAAIRSLSDTLSQEIKLYTPSVKVHTVFPGSIQTPGLENENLTKPAITKILEADDPVQTPEVVAQKSIKGLENGEYLIVVNFLAAAMRGCAWGGSRRNNWVTDTLMTWVTSIAWMFIGRDLDGKVVKFGREHGHPNTYAAKGV